MAETPRGERPRTGLDPNPPAPASPDAVPPAGYPPYARTPHPRTAAAGDGRAAARSAAAPLPALGGDFLTAALDLLCRREPLTPSEIGDHADVVAEVADALAAVADRLATDLARTDPQAGGPAADDLVCARDALHAGSGEARRGAAVLWAQHIRTLRDRVEHARGGDGPARRPAHRTLGRDAGEPELGSAPVA